MNKTRIYIANGNERMIPALKQIAYEVINSHIDLQCDEAELLFSTAITSRTGDYPAIMMTSRGSACYKVAHNLYVNSDKMDMLNGIKVVCSPEDCGAGFIGNNRSRHVRIWYVVRLYDLATLSNEAKVLLRSKPLVAVNQE